MVKKFPRIKDALLGGDGETTRPSADEPRPEGPVERLLAFLDIEEEDVSTEAVQEEMRQDGIDPQMFSERLKQTVLDAYAKARAEAQREEAWQPELIAPDDEVNWPKELEQLSAIAANPPDDLALFDEMDLAELVGRQSIDSAPDEWHSVISLSYTSRDLAAPVNRLHADARTVLAVPALGSPQTSSLDLQTLPKADRLGLAGTLINMMGEHKRLVVRPFTAISNHTALSLGPTVIGQREKADYVLDWGGGVAGERLLVSAQLVGARNGEPLGEKRFYDGSLSDVYQMSGQISQHIALDLGLKTPVDMLERRKYRYTKDRDAVHSYNLGRFYWNKFTEPDLVKAISKFEYCIRRDPGFAEAYAGLADCYTWMGILNMRSPQETFQLARERARQALLRDDGIAEAHTSLAFTEMYFDWNWKGAEERFLHAISLNPNYETAYQGLAQLMMALMRFDEALAAIDQALLIHPKSFIINVAKGIILYEAERFDECIEQFKETIELNPKYDASYYGLALALEQKGRLKEAEKESRRAIVRSKRNPIKLTGRGHIHALLNETRQACKVLDELNSLRRTHQYVSPFHMALMYAGLGETDRAFDFLEQAYQDNDQWLTLLRSEPRLKELRGDPRFRSLVLRLNWPTA
jgi:tetratricopeptide (TPR) repeat protein